MKRFAVCDWIQRIPEVKDLGYDGLRSSTAEFSTFFEKKPAFVSPGSRQYEYEIDWAATNSSGGSTNRFATSAFAGDMTLKDALLQAKAEGMDCIIEIRYNGYRNNWSTPNIFFSYTRHTVTTSAGASGGATALSVNSTGGAIPNGAELVFARSGSYTTRAYISLAASGGTTSTIQVYDLQIALNSGDKIAIVRNGVLIETATVSGYPESTLASDNRNIVLSGTLSNSIQLNDAVYIFSSGATIITATKTTARYAAAALSINVVALSTSVNSGDYAVVADVPTSVEPYGYRSPDPADASAHADGALAMIAYALNDPTILFPESQLWIEFYNEPDQRVFGASGIPDGYAYGHGFFPSNIREIVSAQILACKAAFPNVRLIGPTFSYGDASVMNSVRSENLITSGLAQIGGIDSYWSSVDALNVHIYSYSQDGTLRSCAKEANDSFSTYQSNARAFTPLANIPWIVTECGVRTEYLYGKGVPHNSTAVAANILVCHDVCQALGAVGWTHYCYVQRDPGSRYTLTASGTHSIGATTINLTGTTGVIIPSGAVLFFGTQGSKVTLTSAASAGATSLSVSPITVGISNNDKSYFHAYLGEQAFHMIPYSVGVHNLHIGVDDPEGKNGIFWEFARRFARVPIAETPVPIPDL